jgi:UDP-glucose 4-epimerase
MERDGRRARPTAIVTGANGFLGRYVVRRLLEDGYSVVAVGRSVPPAIVGSASYQYVQLDLDGSHAVRTMTEVATTGTDAFVHLAAVFPPSLDSPDADDCGQRNLRVDRNVLDVCERLACPLIFASSASIYATTSPNVIREDSPIDGNQPYAREKLETEHAGMERSASGGQRFVALRITAPYGAGQPTRTVVRIFLDQARKGEPLRYHGTGARQQDFVHAADVADAVARAINAPATGVFNIGSGSPLAMSDLARLVVEAVPGSRSVVEPSGKPDPQETRFARFAIDKAQRELDWRPRVRLAEGIAEWAHALGADRGHASRVPV